MRKVLISFVFLLACGAVGLWTALQSPRFWEFVVAKTINTGRAMQIREVSIDDVHWSFPRKVIFENVRAKLRINDVSYFVSMGAVELQAKHSLMNFNFRAELNIAHTAVVSDFLNISDAQLQGVVDFKSLKLTNAQGHLKAQEVDVGHYVFTDVESDFQFNAQRMTLHLNKGQFAQGTLNADIIMDYQPRISYSVMVNVKGADPSRLMEIRPRIFGAVRGAVNAHVAARFQAGHLVSLTAALDAPSGGKVKSYALQDLAQYIPQGEQLKSLIKSKTEYSFDRGSMVLSSEGGDRFTTQIKMLSSPLNLDMNVTMDVIIDNGILCLWDDLSHGS